MTGDTFELAGRRYYCPVPIVGISDKGERTIAGAIPTAAVRKGDDLVCYSMTGEAADLVLANAGRAPILQSHRRSIDYLLGAISAAWFDNGVLCFTGRLAPVDEAARLWSLLSAGFPLSVSFGTQIVDATITGETPWGGKRITVQRWKLDEISFCLYGVIEEAHAVRLDSDEGRKILASRKATNVQAIRDRLRLDHWQRWSIPAGMRLADALGTDPDRTATLLCAEVDAYADTLVAEHA